MIDVIRPDIKIVQTIDPSIAIPWIKEQADIANPVRNTNHEYLKFVNTTYFSEEARHFLRHGFYTSAKFGTKDYNEYWDLQEDRVNNGYSVGGVRIPGRYYYFLNFCQMKARPIDTITGLEKKARKIITFPRFLDHQYYFFLELEECFAEGPHEGKPMQGICIFKSRRKGFEQPLSEPIMTPSGFTTMGEIKVGDLTIGSDGLQYPVTDKYNNGLKDVYEVVLLDGRKIRCGLEHLWQIEHKLSQKIAKREVVDTKYLLEHPLSIPMNGGKDKYYKYYIQNISPIEFEKKVLLVPPYTMGLLLGDETINGRTKGLKISTKDEEILNSIQQEIGDEYRLTFDKGSNCNYGLVYKHMYDIPYNMAKGLSYDEVKFGYHPLRRAINALGVNKGCDDKFIPDVYKYSTIEDRLALLQGLFDSDGSVNKYGQIDFSNKSRQLIEDVAFVLRSIGINCTLGEEKATNHVYRLYVQGNQELFRLTRKLARIRPDKHYRQRVPIIAVNKLPYKEQCSCITVNSPDHLYLTAGLVPTHNTYVVAGGVYNYNVNFVPASMNVLAAYQKDFFKVTLDGIHFTLNHTNKSTDWAKRRDKLDQRDHFRVSFVTKNEAGMDVEDGYMSEVHAISFKDDPFKSIGESAFVVGFEEAGQFPGMLSALTIAEPTYRDGDIMTGIPIIWGSAGNTNAVTDLEEVFYNGDAYGLKTFENIYDENATGDCGFFIDDLWYYPGMETSEGTKYMVDAQGNSLRAEADKSIDQKRERKKKGSKNSFNLFITQQPKRPSEGFLRSVGTIFNTVDTKARVAEMVTNPIRYDRTVLRVRMEMSESGHISWVTDLSNQPLHEFPLKDNKNKPGVIEIYEVPVKDSGGNVPSLRYIAGIDSYDDDASDTVSVGSMHILDRFTDRIVASYKARPDTKTWYEQCRRLLLYYNATANYERRNKGIYGHFYNKNSLYLLCDEPEILSEKGISKANKIGNNSKGTYPSTPVKNYGNSLMVAYLDAAAYGEEEDKGVTNLHKIRTLSLLREMIHWTDDERKNFDDVDALRMLVIYRESLLKFEVRNQVRDADLAHDAFWDRNRKGVRNTNPSHIRSSDFQHKVALRRR